MRLTAVSLALLAQAALAHPGHGPETGWLHFLSEPDHLALLLAPLVIGALGWVFLRRRRGGA